MNIYRYVNFYKQAISKLLSDRVLLLRAMEHASSFYNGKFDDLVKELKDPNKSKYLSLSSDLNKITFSKSKEELKSEKFRQEQSLGRFLVRNVDSAKEFSTSEIDGFVKKVFEILSPDITDIKEFDDIEKRYQTYGTNDSGIEQSNTTTPLSSCVTGNNASSIKVFSNNCDKVTLLEFFGGTIRSLVWNCDDGSKVLDRLYPSGHKNNPIIIAWAKKNKMITRKLIDSVDKGDVNLSDGSQRFVTLNVENIRELPYMDTFKFCEVDKINNTARLSNKKIPEQDGLFYDELISSPTNSIPISVKLKSIEDVAKFSFYDLMEAYDSSKQNRELVFEAAKKHAGKALEVIADSDVTPTGYFEFFIDTKDIQALNVLAFSRYWYKDTIDKMLGLISQLEPKAQKAFMSNASIRLNWKQIDQLFSQNLAEEVETKLIKELLRNSKLPDLTFNAIKAAITSDYTTEDELLDNLYISTLSDNGYNLSDMSRYNSLQQYVESNEDIFSQSNEIQFMKNCRILFSNKEMISIVKSSKVVMDAMNKIIEIYKTKYSVEDIIEENPALAEFVK